MSRWMPPPAASRRSQHDLWDRESLHGCFGPRRPPGRRRPARRPRREPRPRQRLRLRVQARAASPLGRVRSCVEPNGSYPEKLISRPTRERRPQIRTLRRSCHDHGAHYPVIMRVHVADHPLITHKLTVLRDERTPSPVFRQLTEELVTLLAYEATRNVKVSPVEITTPVKNTMGVKISEPRPIVVPILRAGLGMLEGLVKLLPTA